MNNTFYKKQLEIHKNDPTEVKKIKIHQQFVQNYLSTETPFRGLLVYHGLGTGKTRTAVTTAEGLSNNMPIYTMLPASLESEFLNEVRNWGDVSLKLKGTIGSLYL